MKKLTFEEAKKVKGGVTPEIQACLKGCSDGRTWCNTNGGTTCQQDYVDCRLGCFNVEP